VATFAQKLAILYSTVGKGSNFELGKGDLQTGNPRGGIETVRRSLAGILDLLGQLGTGEAECGCWSEGVEDRRGEETGYEVVEDDFSKLHIFPNVAGGPGAYEPFQIILPDPNDFPDCTRIGITTLPPVVAGPDPTVQYVLSSPFLPGQPGVGPWIFVGSPYAPMMDLNIGTPPITRIPGIHMGGDPEGGLPYPVWSLIEAVVGNPGEFGVEGKGWWVKNIDMLFVLAGAVPP